MYPEQVPYPPGDGEAWVEVDSAGGGSSSRSGGWGRGGTVEVGLLGGG